LVEIDLAAEMAAARQRRETKTAAALRDSRVLALRAALSPGASRIEIEERARSFYPRLSPELLEEATSILWNMQRGSSPAAVPTDDLPLEELEIDPELAAEAEPEVEE
jgi:hypothetical protein